jgi:hypothetical protein
VPLLLGRFTGGLNVTRLRVVPEAYLECPGKRARAESVVVSVFVNDFDVPVRIPEVHHIRERDLHSFTACVKEED